MARVKTLYKSDYERLRLWIYPNFHVSGSITGMRKIYGKNALLVRCGSYIYNVSGSQHIYDRAH